MFGKKHTLEQFIKKSLKGNLKAQKALYDRYSGLMLALCFRYVPECAEAEDLMIRGFTKVFERLGQYAFAGSFEGWMRRLFVNECLMFLRKNKPYITSIETAETKNAPNNTEGLLEAQDLLALVGQLPEGYRLVFNLFAIEGYSHKEIASCLGISEGTSKSQLSKARRMLQRQLQTEEKIISSH